MAKIVQIKEKNEPIYPVTLSEAVLCPDGNNIEEKINNSGGNVIIYLPKDDNFYKDVTNPDFIANNIETYNKLYAQDNKSLGVSMQYFGRNILCNPTMRVRFVNDGVNPYYDYCYVLLNGNLIETGQTYRLYSNGKVAKVKFNGDIIIDANGKLNETITTKILYGEEDVSPVEGVTISRSNYTQSRESSSVALGTKWQPFIAMSGTQLIVGNLFGSNNDDEFSLSRVAYWDKETNIVTVFGGWTHPLFGMIDSDIQFNFDPIAQTLTTVEETITLADWATITGYRLTRAKLYSFREDNLTEYLDKKANIEDVNSALSLKQNILTAGKGINIDNNTISAESIFRLVTELPEVGEEGIIYLIPNSDGVTPNVLLEFMYINSIWELIGEYQSTVDLTDYITKEEVANTYQPKEENKGLSSNDFTDHLKSELDNISQGLNIKSVQTVTGSLPHTDETKTIATFYGLFTNETQYIRLKTDLGIKWFRIKIGWQYGNANYGDGDVDVYSIGIFQTNNETDPYIEIRCATTSYFEQYATSYDFELELITVEPVIDPIALEFQSYVKAGGEIAKTVDEYKEIKLIDIDRPIYHGDDISGPTSDMLLDWRDIFSVSQFRHIQLGLLDASAEINGESWGSFTVTHKYWGVGDIDFSISIYGPSYEELPYKGGYGMLLSFEDCHWYLFNNGEMLVLSKV